MIGKPNNSKMFRSKKTCPGIILSSIDYKFNALSLMMICNLKNEEYIQTLSENNKSTKKDKRLNKDTKTNNHQQEQIQITTDEQHEPIQNRGLVKSGAPEWETVSTYDTHMVIMVMLKV